MRMITYELDATYDHITNDIRIRSKWDWYEHTKNIEQQRGAQITIKNSFLMIRKLQARHIF